LVVTVNVAVDCPAGTVICGTDAASSMSELVSVTTVPAAGAAALSVTVHVAEPPLPPAMTDGLQESALAVCAKALEAGSAHAIRATPMANRARFVPFFNFTTLLLSCASPRDFREDGGLCASLRPAENRREFDDSFSGTFARTNVGGQRELIRPRS